MRPRDLFWIAFGGGAGGMAVDWVIYFAVKWAITKINRRSK